MNSSKINIPEIDTSMLKGIARGWNQPSRDKIIVKNTEVLMTISTYRLLNEYNHSNPSGVYVGKMWSRQVVKIGNKITHYLCWYDYLDEQSCAIKCLPIRVVSSVEFDEIKAALIVEDELMKDIEIHDEEKAIMLKAYINADLHDQSNTFDCFVAGWKAGKSFKKVNHA